MKVPIWIPIVIIVGVVLLTGQSCAGERSLLHFKRDLEYRLNSYLNLRETIKSIVSTSIQSVQDRQPASGQRRLFTARNVRFSDLIIPNGALVLDRQFARPTVDILGNKTLNYVSSKMNELEQIRNQLDTIKRQVNDPRQTYVYKGLPNRQSPPLPPPVVGLPGTWLFKQFLYGQVLTGQHVDVKQINYTSVDHVLNETYMTNPKFDLYDSQARLFFEGRKTFWNTVFLRPLRSGCCDRLKPLHTSRMMLRSASQTVRAPCLFQTGDLYSQEPVMIDQLDTNQFSNRLLIASPTSPGRAAGAGAAADETLGLLQSPMENFIQPNSLIPIDRAYKLELPKTIIFKDQMIADEAYLSASPLVPTNSNRLLIGFAWNQNMQPFDLSHENYLLRNSSTVQRVQGSLIINGESHFLSPIEALSVNGISNFRRFATESVVRVDRPAIIRGPIQFNALPAVFGGNQPIQNVVMMQVDKGMQVGPVNGMRLPEDLVLLAPNPQAIPPNRLILVRGPRLFTGKLVARDLMYVNRHINGMEWPSHVVPLHLNDFMGSVGGSNLWFTDGIVASQVTIQSGYLDDIHLRGAHSDAQNLIMNSVFSSQADGSQLIRAPLRVRHLKLFGSEPNQGLLNGFRPQNLLELRRSASTNDGPSSIYGRKNFLATVEANECILSDINNLPGWPKHLIRTDRPGTVQTIHTRLAFVQPKASSNYVPPQSSSLSVRDLRVEFYANENRQQYLSNWNLSPEFLMLHQALAKDLANHTTGRYRVLDQVRLIGPLGAAGRVNNILLEDIVTLDAPFRFAGGFVLVGKVDVLNSVYSNRITSNYPIDAMDLVQFDKFRVPILGSLAPIRLSNLVLAANNQASFLNCRMLNGIPFDEFINSIMSLTRPQIIDSGLVFNRPAHLEGFIRTESSLNSIKNFRRFADNLRSASYSFEDGLQCNSVIIKSNRFV